MNVGKVKFNFHLIKLQVFLLVKEFWTWTNKDSFAKDSLYKEILIIYIFWNGN
jgi:hypothetical protein